MTDLTKEIQDRYGRVARGDEGCCGSTTTCCATGEPETIALQIGYSPEDVALAGEGNLGLGCGNPLALAAIEPGMTVLDLGSGAGFDAFLAAERAGPTGRVIGVDMTPDMLTLARRNAQARGAGNVEFREGRIEALPVDDASVDLVISNCVINLSSDKPAVFRELARVLKPGGRVSVSDLVLTGPLPESIKSDVLAYVGCVAGALPLGEYVALLHEHGLGEVSLPRVTPASAMVEGTPDLPAEDVRRAAAVLVSAVFTATKPRTGAAEAPATVAAAACCS